MTEDQKAAERADFENHIRGRYGNYVLLERYANTYALPKFAEAWQAWQARAALAQPEPVTEGEVAEGWALDSRY